MSKYICKRYRENESKTRKRERDTGEPTPVKI